MQSSPTHRASFSIGTEAAAKRVVDVLTEVFFEGDAAVAAFEQPDGHWDVTLHFAEAPDQTLLREIIVNSAGNEIAGTLTFDTVEAKDWVKAASKTSFLCRRGASSCTAATTATASRRTSSPSKSRRRSPSVNGLGTTLNDKFSSVSTSLK